MDATTAQITLTSRDQFQGLLERKIDVYNVVGLEVYAYLVPSEFNALQAAGYRVRWIPDLSKHYADSLWAATKDSGNPMLNYHTYEEMRNELILIANNHPNICHVDSIGRTVQGRGLWFMKISDNVNAEEAEPEFKYISSMHGNEVVGKEMCMYLINYLVDNYGVLPRVTNLVDNVEIWIMPSMNPDGTALHQRYNANGVDLNRDFPDRVDDSTNTTSGREIEVQDVMNWAFQHSSILSANFHCGTLVANYPWDGNYSHQSGVYSACPEDALFIQLSLAYSTHNLPMYNGPFPQGITNGCAWYVIYGGMQDWNYVWMGDREITMEISNVNWPDQSTLPQYWEDNRESMLSYMEQVLLGIKGIVTDATTGVPMAARVRLGTTGYDTYTDPALGDYYRILLPGTYSLTFSATGYVSQTISGIVVAEGAPTVVNVQLLPLGQYMEIFFDNFATDLGWTGYGGVGEWTRGSPLGGSGDDTHGGPDPTQDHSPTTDNFVIGNDLTATDGDYESGLAQTYWLTSPIINCLGAVGATLEYWQWLGVERSQYDHAYLQVYNGSSWVTKWQNGSTTMDQNSWNQQLIDVSAEADHNAQFRIRFGIGVSDGSWQYCGWNLDDLKVSGYSQFLPAIANLVVERRGVNSIGLSWSAIPGATYYRIYRGSTPDFVVGPGSLLAEISSANTSYVDSGVINQFTKVFYRVTARN
jgi:carboxypeptidase D